MRLLVLAFFVALAGCDALLGIEELPRGTTSNDASVVDAAPQPNEACISCETSACASEKSTCTGDAACAPLLACLELCAAGEVLCRGECERKHVAGARTKAFADIDLCRRKSCVDACFGGSGFGSAIDSACGCVNPTCAAQMLACVQSGVTSDPPFAPGACDRRLACIAHKPNPDNYVDCVMDLEGGDQANALLGCMRDTDCPTDDSGPKCSIYSGVLGCLRNYSYATTSAPIKAFTFGLETLAKEPVKGATVIACSPAKCGPDCIVQGTGVTDEFGKATFELKTAEGAFDGCIYVPPYQDYMGMNVVPGRRIRRNETMVTSYALPEGILAIYTEGGKPLITDGTRGHVLIAIHDCIWRRLPGASVSMTDIDAETQLAYLQGTDVVPEMATTRTGAAAYINVPVGVHEITVTVGDVTIARQKVTVRGRELTDVNIYPLAKN